jgi:hypothetical protein
MHPEYPEDQGKVLLACPAQLAAVRDCLHWKMTRQGLPLFEPSSLGACIYVIKSPQHGSKSHPDSITLTWYLHTLHMSAHFLFRVTDTTLLARQASAVDTIIN